MERRGRPAKKAGTRRRRRGGEGKPTPAAKREDRRVWVASALDGTQDLVREELVRRFGRDCAFLKHGREHEIHFTLEGPAEGLLTLRTAQTLMLRKDFAVTRPRTLLSPEHVIAMGELIDTARNVPGAGKPSGVRFDAAGSGSPTMMRIAEQLADRTGLPFDPENGDCVVTFRPGEKGWEVLVRVGNRPLATRDWRTVNYRGSLNAAIASCMVELTQPKRADRYLNLMCGGGTLLIERLLRTRASVAVGIDISAEAIAATEANAKAARLAGRVRLVRGDARDVDAPNASFDAVTVDLPYGATHGDRTSNAALYLETLDEAARLCAPGGTLVAITQDRMALRTALAEAGAAWQVVGEREIVQRSYKPVCVACRRR